MVDKNETKAQRFQRVAAPRVSKVLAALRHLERCASRVTYEYSVEDVGKVLGAIDERVQALHKAFAPQEAKPRKARPQDGFRF